MAASPQTTQLNTVDVLELEYQANVYSLSVLHHRALPHPVAFVATCDSVHCLLRRCMSTEDRQMEMYTLPLSDFPEHHRLLGIDCYAEGKNVILGVTFIPESEDKLSKELCAEEKDASLGQFQIYKFHARLLSARRLKSGTLPYTVRLFSLDYTPLKLTHYCTQSEGRLSLFLLYGADQQLHCYYHEPELQYIGSRCVYSEFQLSEPLFCPAPSAASPYLPSSMLSMDYCCRSRWRACATGGQDGYLGLTIVSALQQEQEQQQQVPEVDHVWLSGPLVSLQFFTFRGGPVVEAVATSTPHSEALQALLAQLQVTQKQQQLSMEDEDEDEEVNLLVAEAIGRVLIFLDVRHSGLRRSVTLPQQGDVDLFEHGVTCAHAGDLHQAGWCQVAVATWNNKLCVYELTSATTATPEFALAYSVDFGHPVYAMASTDLNGDGVRELLLCGQFECYILQPKPAGVRERLVRMLTLLEGVVASSFTAAIPPLPTTTAATTTTTTGCFTAAAQQLQEGIT